MGTMEAKMKAQMETTVHSMNEAKAKLYEVADRNNDSDIIRTNQESQIIVMFSFRLIGRSDCYSASFRPLSLLEF